MYVYHVQFNKMNTLWISGKLRFRKENRSEFRNPINNRKKRKHQYGVIPKECMKHVPCAVDT